jgi:hypothetical protein
MLCWMIFIGHPAKTFFAECQTQRHPANRALGKVQPSAKIGLCQVPAKVVDVTAATCRHPLSSAAPLGTRQSIFLISLPGAP